MMPQLPITSHSVGLGSYWRRNGAEENWWRLTRRILGGLRCLVRAVRNFAQVHAGLRVFLDVKYEGAPGLAPGERS